MTYNTGKREKILEFLSKNADKSYTEIARYTVLYPSLFQTDAYDAFPMAKRAIVRIST